MTCFRLSLLSALVFAAPAAAAITDVSVHGHGVVTYSVPDYSYPLIGQAVGTPVTVDASIHLGTATGNAGAGFPAAPPDHFTGRFTLTMDMVFDHYSSYSWRVTPGDFATSFDPADDYSGGTLDFVNGRLVDFDLTYVGDPDGHYLSTHRWGFDFGYASPAMWGGTWSAVPEPTAWGLLFIGFGFVGMTARRRRVAA